MRRYLNKIRFVYSTSDGLSHFGAILWYIFVSKVAHLFQLRKLLSKTTLISLKFNNKPIRLRIGYAHIATFFEIFLQKPYDFDFHLRNNPTIIDLGGHIGLASLFFVAKYNPKTLITLEPDKKNYNLLQTNLPKATIINKAISDKGGTLYMQMSEESVNHKISQKGIPVESISMKSLILDYKLEQIDLLKIDIEGYEVDLLEHIKPWISIVHNIIIELHNGLDQEFLDDKLGPYGFNIKQYQKDIFVAQRLTS